MQNYIASCLALLLGFLNVISAGAIQVDDTSIQRGHLWQFVEPNTGQQQMLEEAVVQSFRNLDHWLGRLDAVEKSRLQSALKLDELRRSMETGFANAGPLRDLERGFYGLTQGLDQEPIIQLRTALTRLVDYRAATGCDDLPAEFDARMRDLNAALTDAGGPDTTRIAGHVAWLIAIDQVPEWVTDLQQQFRHPCIVVDVNPEMLAPWLTNYRQEISHSQFATNQIVGVPVSGMSHVHAVVSPTLQEAAGHVTLRLEIDGTIESPDNESRPDPQRAPLIGNVSVALKSSGSTSIDGYKDIFWNGQELVAEPAEVHCRTSSEVEDIDISRNYRRPATRIAKRVDRQIQKRANKEIQQKTPTANRESAEIARKQISAQLDEQVDGLIQQANADIEQFYRAPLSGLGLFPIGTGESTATSIRLGFRGRNSGAIGAPETLPHKEMIGDLELSLHESMGNSLWAGWLKGRQLSDADLRRVHREVRGFVPHELKVSGNEPWSVRLNSATPLKLRFRDGILGLQFQADSLTIEGTEYQFAFSVAASYQVEPEFDMPRFIRDGEVQIRWPDEAVETELKSKLQPFLLGKFNAFFPREMHLDGLSAPAGGQWGTASKLKIVSSSIDQGWWKLVFKARDLNQLN